MSFHDVLTGADIHVAHAFTYANAAARTGATGLGSTDIGKIAKQTDNNTYWVLKDDSPLTWGQLDAAGGGGGGGEWRAGSTNPSPTDTIEYDQKVWKFAASDKGSSGHSLYRLFKIPNGYNAGSQISLKVDLYSPSTSGTILMKAICTLIRAGTDAVSSTTNQHTSTNTAITLDATANKCQTATLDITDGSGDVNSVAVSAGDELRIQLYRDNTDTDTADMRFVPDSTDFVQG